MEKRNYQSLVATSRHIDVGVSQNMSKPLGSVTIRFEEFYNQPREEQHAVRLTFDGDKKIVNVEIDGKRTPLPMSKVLETLVGLT